MSSFVHLCKMQCAITATSASANPCWWDKLQKWALLPLSAAQVEHGVHPQNVCQPPPPGHLPHPKPQENPLRIAGILFTKGAHHYQQARRGSTTLGLTTVN